MFKPFELECISCGEKYKTGNFYNCIKCGGILNVKYNQSKYKLKNNQLIVDNSIQGLWSYKEYLPINNENNICSLAEGHTPLIKSKISEISGNLFFKDETRNPTGSFKDRPTTVSISKAIENKCKGVVAASSGNAGIATAAYAAVAKLPAIIFVPENLPNEKLLQASIYGAKIIKVRGDYSSSFELAKKVALEYNYANLTSTYYNPYGLEGDKTIAFEMYNQLGHLVPDFIIIPIGAGPLLTGIYKGYLDLKEMNLIEKLPKMIGVQAKGCSPIVKAFKENNKNVEPWNHVNTIASGISDPLKGYDQDGTYTLNIIKGSGGYAISVSDEEIIDSVFSLGNGQGIFVEPTSATVFCGYKQLRKSELIKKDDLTVSIITGIGFKDTKPLYKFIGKIPIVEASLMEFDSLNILENE
jgi:threonine synthase